MIPSPCLLLFALVAGFSLHAHTASLCLLLCGRDYNPVCGGNQEEKHSFLNECELNAFNCRMKKDLVVLDRSRVCPGDERLFE